MASKGSIKGNMTEIRITPKKADKSTLFSGAYFLVEVDGKEHSKVFSGDELAIEFKDAGLKLVSRIEKI